MRMTVAMTTLALATFWVLVGTNSHAGEDKKDKGAKKGKAPYVHAVIFYLKKDAPKDEADVLIADCHKLLAKIPSVKGLWAGLPAEKSTPKFAVTDYQVGLLVLFDNFDGLQVYLDHPLHSEFVDRHLKYLEKVPVYDFVNK